MWRLGTGCPTGRGGGPSLPCNLTQTCWPTGRRTATARRRRGDGAATARRRRGDPTAMDCITIRARSTMVQTDVPSLRPRQRSTRRESREAQTRNMDPCVRAPSVVLCETYFAPTLRSVPPSSPRGRPLHRAPGRFHAISVSHRFVALGPSLLPYLEADRSTGRLEAFGLITSLVRAAVQAFFHVYRRRLRC